MVGANGRLGNRYLRCARPQSGKPGGEPYWGREFIAICFDAHNGLQKLNDRYTGLDYISLAKKSVYVEYKELIEKMSHFSQVLYCYSDCS